MVGVCGGRPAVLLEDTVETDPSREAASTSLAVDDEDGEGDGGLMFTKSINAPILEYNNNTYEPVVQGGRREEFFKGELMCAYLA